MQDITTFEEAVAFVAERIDKDTVNNPYFHFSGGMAVRNELGLWDKDSSLYKHMLERFGLCHADDTGSLITQAANAKKNDQSYDPEPDVLRFKRHWTALGYNPATMKPLSEWEKKEIEKTLSQGSVLDPKVFAK